jgi:PTS system cellobiose-specific IIA component
MNEKEVVIMQMILQAGNAKSHAYEALRQTNEGKYQEAEKEMQLAHDAMGVAHNAQTSLLHAEAGGEKMEITVLFIHAQDHLMTTMSELSLIEQIMELRKVVNTLL